LFFELIIAMWNKLPILFVQMQITSDQHLDDESVNLVKQAEAALPGAYAPYSGFQVAAAILLDDGQIITGTNQENAAYPLCMCAERVALFAKTSMHPARSIIKLAVVAKQSGSTSLVPATPCGACRQVMSEFESRQNHPFEVVMLTSERGWLKLPSAQALLPFSFGSSNLIG
jgi:cytidine deaminase